MIGIVFMELMCLCGVAAVVGGDNEGFAWREGYP